MTMDICMTDKVPDLMHRLDVHVLSKRMRLGHHQYRAGSTISISSVSEVKCSECCSGSETRKVSGNCITQGAALYRIKGSLDCTCHPQGLLEAIQVHYDPFLS